MLETREKKSITDILKQLPEKIVLSNPSDKGYKYKKTVIQKINDNNKRSGNESSNMEETRYQVERFTDKQAFHDNIKCSQLADYVFDDFPDSYRQMNIFTEEGSADYKISKKGKLLSSVSDNKATARVSHNRKKNYLLKEGSVIPPLVDLGIFTKEGRIVNSMYDKYKQINRFIELVDDVIKNYHTKKLKEADISKPDDDAFNIIDFGCGKSYLTFIIYYYLVEIRGLNVNMTGLDLKEAVIDKCNATAEKYHYDKLHFELGDINGYKTDRRIDMVITLHACDTATDYALYNAISWNAEIILSVPCCQHELNSQIESNDFSILTRYGIVKERVSALMTDAIRANVLEYCGYNTQLLEFIDIAHSPKNILIRAVRKKNSRLIDPLSDVSENERGLKAWDEAKRLCEEFHLKPTLMELVINSERNG